jgi:hypothetical protein
MLESSDVLLRLIEDARRRLASRRAWRWGGRTALAAAAVTLLAVLLRMVVPLEVPMAAAPASLAAGLLVVVAVRLATRVPPLVAAQVLDERFGLADRLATSVELVTGRHPRTLLAPLALNDAVARAAALDLRRTLPGGPDRTAGLAVVAAALAAVLGGALVGVSLPGTPAHEVIRTIQREGRRLERAAETLEERARTERARVARRTAPAIQRLGEALQRERMERRDALARLENLGRQVDAERRQVQARRQQFAGERPGRPDLPADLFQQRAAVDRTLRQIRELTDRLATARTPEEREALLRQLAALAGGGDQGDVPTRTREQAEAARQQMAAGDAAGARRALQQSAADLDDLRAMLADEEGLEQAQRDLRRSSEQIAGGRSPGEQAGEEVPQAGARSGTVAPGNRPPSDVQGPEQAEPLPGPNQGTTPGEGVVEEKLGARTQRLEADREQTRIEGRRGEGRTITSELLGPGRTARVTAPAGPPVSAARADADRYLERLRVPPEYREIVRRYFEALAGAR